jgi:hypothetical protein
MFCINIICYLRYAKSPFIVRMSLNPVIHEEEEEERNVENNNNKAVLRGVTLITSGGGGEGWR